MNNQAKASHDALGPSQRGAAGHQIYNYDSNKDKLLADLKSFATLRTRLEMKENPWKPAGASAAAGVIFGLFLGRR